MLQSQCINDNNTYILDVIAYFFLLVPLIIIIIKAYLIISLCIYNFNYKV